MLPVGVTGLVLAGLIAAIVSSVDSTLNSASTLTVHDFVLEARPDTPREKIGTYGKIATLVLVIVAILWAPQIANFGGLWVYLQQAFGILVPPIVAIFLVGAFWRRANGTGAIRTLGLSHGVGLLLFVAGQFDPWPVHFTINVGIMTVFSVAVLVITSLRSPALDPEVVERTTWTPGLSARVHREEGNEASRGGRFAWSAILGTGMALVLFVFW